MLGKRGVNSADAVGSVAMEDAMEHKKRRPASNDLPTKEEQRQLQQVDLLMKTNILQLKVESMLEEVSVCRLLHKRKAQDWIDSLVTLLTMRDDDGDDRSRQHDLLGSTIDSLWMSRNGIAGLSLVNESDATMRIIFVPPIKVDIVGSFVHDTITSSHVNIDIALTLPDELFDSRYSSVFVTSLLRVSYNVSPKPQGHPEPPLLRQAYAIHGCALSDTYRRMRGEQALR